MTMKKKIKISGLRRGSIKHEALPGGLVEKIREIKAILAEVEPTSLEQTLDGFQRDSDPVREVVIWERIAETYRVFLLENLITDYSTKREVFSVVVAASIGVEDFSSIKSLNPGQIERLIESYRARVNGVR
jgi:hypothetical protein